MEKIRKLEKKIEEIRSILSEILSSIGSDDIILSSLLRQVNYMLDIINIVSIRLWANEEDIKTMVTELYGVFSKEISEHPEQKEKMAQSLCDSVRALAVTVGKKPEELIGLLEK